MTLQPIHDPAEGQLRIAGFMSGKGTNLIKIIEHEIRLQTEYGQSPYSVVVILTSNPKSNAYRIGEKFERLVVKNDILAFAAEHGVSWKDKALRQEYDAVTVEKLKPYHATIAAYAGYDLWASPVLVKAILGVNVHPCDTSILGPDHLPVYSGSNAVRNAILAGEKYLRSTTHIIAEKVDTGGIFMLSKPHEVVLGRDFELRKREDGIGYVDKVANENQELLKAVGDLDIFPLTLQLIAQGRFQRDGEKRLYFDGKPIPAGVKRENLVMQGNRWKLK